LNRALAALERHRIEGLARLEADFDSRRQQLRLEAESGIAALESEHAAKRHSITERRRVLQARLETELREVVEPGYALLAAARQAVDQAFAGLALAIMGRVGATENVHFRRPLRSHRTRPRQGVGRCRSGAAVQTAGPTRLEVAADALPPAGRLGVVRDAGPRPGSAVGALNNLVLRLLGGAPPGRIAFTILDPVSLGQNFAGLMHLADHADRLINRRIWTQPEQIDQQLGDLNEHIEKVTQLYLRNEYSSIAEYNQQAGRVAEPYQFLVIADFPVGFSDLAIRRLLSILSSGPRCGVFTLVHWDRRQSRAAEFSGEDIRKAGIWLESRGSGFGLSRPTPPGLEVSLDDPPDAALATALLQRIGRSSIDAYRVELPFAQIAPKVEARWSLDTAVEVRVPVGITGATKLQQLALGKGTRQHALIAGKTGSGKSTLFHVLITNLALWAGPTRSSSIWSTSRKASSSSVTPPIGSRMRGSSPSRAIASSR
jgi:DNA segregation ATPase FtsK/SpoIIIE, S-DNA-T family